MTNKLLRPLGLALLLCGLSCVPLVLGTVSGAAPALTVLPLAAALATGAVRRLPAWARAPVVALAMGAGAWAAFLITPAPQSAPGIFYIAACAAIPALVPPLLRDGLSSALGLGLGLAQLVIYVLAIFSGQSARAALPPLAAVAGVYLCLFFLHENAAQLRRQTVARGGARPAGMLGVNALMTALLAAACFVLANAQNIWAWIKQAASAVAEAVMRLLSYLTPQETTSLGAGGGGGMEQLVGEAGEASPVWSALEKLIYVLLAALTAWALLKFIRLAPDLWRKAMARLRRLMGRYGDALNADYTDETVRLEREADAQALHKARRRRRRTDWASLSPRQTVRAAYRQWLSAQERPPLTLTAREALGDETVAEVYDRARYSDHAVTGEEAGRVRTALEGRAKKKRAV